MEALTNTVNHVKTELLPDVDFDQFDHAHDHHDGEEAVAPSAKSEDNGELKWD
jgi:hypothetical protein